MEMVVDELGAVFVCVGVGICVITWMASLLAYISLLL